MLATNLFLLLISIAVCLPWLLVKANDTPGHMQPLGSHRPPMQIDVVEKMLHPLEFFDKYVQPSKPVLMKGAAKNFPSFGLWKNDSYLK